MEGSRPRVESCGEQPGGALGEAGEPPHQKAKVTHKQVSEEHVEQQLLVVPLGPVCWLMELDRSRGAQQVPEVSPNPIHLGTDLVSLHRPLRGALLTFEPRGGWPDAPSWRGIPPRPCGSTSRTRANASWLRSRSSHSRGRHAVTRQVG